MESISFQVVGEKHYAMGTLLYKYLKPIFIGVCILALFACSGLEENENLSLPKVMVTGVHRQSEVRVFLEGTCSQKYDPERYVYFFEYSTNGESLDYGAESVYALYTPASDSYFSIEPIITSQTTIACRFCVRMVDGPGIVYSEKETFSFRDIEGVDLGLSVKWASANIGAVSAEDCGEYFRWGEIYGKNSSSQPYSFFEGNEQYIFKYNPISFFGTPDYRYHLAETDDVATVRYGGQWHIPGYSEWQELVDECEWTWTEINGVPGYKVSGKKAGYKNKWIFLPAAGSYGLSGLANRTTNGYYWTSDLCSTSPNSAMEIKFNENGRQLNQYYRQTAMPVRPVCGEKDPAVVEKLVIDQTSFEMCVGGQAILECETVPYDAEGKKIIWTSSASGIAEVIDGYVFARGLGSAVIKAQTEDGRISDTCTVRVWNWPEAVDLGLSVKWADCNLGSLASEDAGDSYAYGELLIKNDYTWPNYKWCLGSDDSVVKYNAPEGLSSLDPADDAAHWNLGGGWRIPTNEEWEELVSKCTWSWTTINGVAGYWVSNNGHSIFLPALLSRRTIAPIRGEYWCSDQIPSINPISKFSNVFTITESTYLTGIGTEKRVGRSVRPVCN